MTLVILEYSEYFDTRAAEWVLATIREVAKDPLQIGLDTRAQRDDLYFRVSVVLPFDLFEPESVHQVCILPSKQEDLFSFAPQQLIFICKLFGILFFAAPATNLESPLRYCFLCCLLSWPIIN